MFLFRKKKKFEIHAKLFDVAHIRDGHLQPENVGRVLDILACNGIAQMNLLNAEEVENAIEDTLISSLISHNDYNLILNYNQTKYLLNILIKKNVCFEELEHIVYRLKCDKLIDILSNLYNCENKFLDSSTYSNVQRLIFLMKEKSKCKYLVKPSMLDDERSLITPVYSNNKKKM